MRRLREAHSIKLEEVAEQLGVAASTLSRIETGKAPTKSVYLSAMLEMYGVDDPAQRQVLIDMAREGHRKGWWSVYDDVLPTGFGIYVGLEAEAAGLRSFQGEAVEGLLQTPDYATRCTTGSSEPGHRRADREAGRPADATPAHAGPRPPLDLWLILDEAVIRRTIGGATVMRATRPPDPGEPMPT